MELCPWQRSWGRRLGIRKGGIEPQESPWKFSIIYPQNQSLPAFCFVLSPTPLTLRGAVPHYLSLINRVNLQLLLIKFLGVIVFQPTNSFGSPLACLNRFSGHMWLLRASQLWEAWDVLNCLNTDSLEQLKDWLEIVLVKGFSLVGPMFAPKSPYPLPAVSLAVYWLI